MAALNHAKIVSALEAIAEKGKGSFVTDFLLAYGTPKATISRIQAGDRQRSVASVAGDVAIPQKLYFREVAQGTSPTDALNEILALPLLEQHKIRFVLVTDYHTVAAHAPKVKDNSEFDFSDLKLNYEFFLPLRASMKRP